MSAIEGYYEDLTPMFKEKDLEDQIKRYKAKCRVFGYAEVKLIFKKDGIFAEAKDRGIREVLIPDFVTEISQNGFKGCEYLEVVEFGEGLKVINESAFFSCVRLKEVRFPSTLREIHRLAFGNCSSLEKVEFNEGLEVIGNAAFNSCAMLKEVKLPTTLREIGDMAFAGTAIDLSNIPEKVTKIGYAAFQGISGNVNVELPRNLKILEQSMFANCKHIFNVKIPHKFTDIPTSFYINSKFEDSVYKVSSHIKTIGIEAFRGTNLKEIILPDGLRRICRGAFRECSELRRINIPQTVEFIGESAFEGCFNLEGNIVLPVRIQEIEDYIFSNCKSLKKVVIPNNVRKIGKYAFENCASLEEVDLPDSIEKLKECAFVNCYSLKRIKLSKNLREIPVGAFSIGEEILEAVRDKLYEAFDLIVEIPEGVEEIKDFAFANRLNLKQIRLPKTLKNLSSKAFLNCVNLRKVYVPTRLKNVIKKYLDKNVIKTSYMEVVYY